MILSRRKKRGDTGRAGPQPRGDTNRAGPQPRGDTNRAGPQIVDPAEAAALVAAGARLIDVREEREWEAGHAPDAEHLPLARLPEAVSSLPRDATIVVVCRSGARSARAASALDRAGFDVVDLGGGMAAWQRAGRPVIRTGGSAGTVA